VAQNVTFTEMAFESKRVGSIYSRSAKPLVERPPRALLVRQSLEVKPRGATPWVRVARLSVDDSHLQVNIQSGHRARGAPHQIRSFSILSSFRCAPDTSKTFPI
jgi:hypothetical protein